VIGTTSASGAAAIGGPHDAKRWRARIQELDCSGTSARRRLASEGAMMEWSVLVETRAPQNNDTSDKTVLDLFGEFDDLLANYGAAAGDDGRGWDARLSVETDDGPTAAVSAIERGADIVLTTADKVGLPQVAHRSD